MLSVAMFGPSPIKTTCILAIFTALSVSSCTERSDPSFEKELLRLTAEKAVLETKLEAVEKENRRMESSISELKSEISLLKKGQSDVAVKKLKELEAARSQRDNDLATLRKEIMELRKLAAKNATQQQTQNNQKQTTTQSNEWKIEVDRNAGGNSRQTTPQNRRKAPTDPNTHEIDWSKAQ